MLQGPGHGQCHFPWLNTVGQSSEDTGQLQGCAGSDTAVPFGAGSKNKPQLFLPVAWISNCEPGPHPLCREKFQP